jgi:hypothetical protein
MQFGLSGPLIGGTDWSDASIWERSMDLLARRVMPDLAKLGVPSPVASGGVA